MKIRMKIINLNPKSSRNIPKNVIVHQNIAYFDHNELMKIDLKTGYIPVQVESLRQDG